MLVRRAVIADQIDFLIGGYCLIDHAQKPGPLLMAVLLLAPAIDFAIGGVQRGKQGCRSVALAIMRHGLAGCVGMQTRRVIESAIILWNS